MKKILIGNDIFFIWKIKNKENYKVELNKAEIWIKIIHQELPEAMFIPNYTINGEEISFQFPADKQKYTGIYHLVIIIKDKNTYKIVNRDTFCLSDIYDLNTHNSDWEENQNVKVKILQVENEVSIMNGRDGKSAYEVALDNGFTGTEKDWLNYLSQNISDATLWSRKGNSKTSPLSDFIGTTDKADFVIKTNNKQIAKFTESGVNFGDNCSQTQSNEIARFHAENKFAPSILLSNDMGKFGYPTLNLAIATDNGHFNKNARKGDSVIIKQGGGGANLVIGTRTFTESTDEETRVIIAPNSVKNNEAIVAKAMTGSKTYVGIHTYNPKDYLEINSRTANDSGVTFTQFTSQTPVTEGATPLGVTEKGKLVTINTNPKDSGWINIKLNENILDFGAYYNDSQYRKIGCKLVLRGLVKFTKDFSQPVLFTLPEGFRPQKRFIATSLYSGNIAVRVDILANGNVQVMNSITNEQWVCLDGIELYLD
ncbi:hypothetical protein [Apibacter sp. HY039]|uniref:hypothetical protein n=1 Tax=Apibacter sp. HY039 TaxID=2501476 RepID=UPI000FEBFCA8|nr:hypothetical protein [Apibacter sp. HY039]